VLDGEDGLFLPNLCGIEATLAVLLIAQCLIFVLHIAQYPDPFTHLQSLALLTLLVQITALSAATLLCLGRRQLSARGERWATLLGLAGILATTAVTSEGAWLAMEATGGATFYTGADQADFILRNLFVAFLVGGLALRYFHARHQLRLRLEAESRAHLAALQARIRPHFLFNCMNTIAALVRTQPEKAEEAVLNLADLFRASLADPRRLVTLREELDLTRHYLELESLRLGERLRVEWRIAAAPEGFALPALLLQPLVENAVRHGIEPRDAGGTIWIGIQGRATGLWLAVENPLPGPAHRAAPGNRMACENIAHRLRAIYGAAARLRTEIDAERYRVEVEIPWPP
jgi:two-component system sensor histidine kinase AlgZ